MSSPPLLPNSDRFVSVAAVGAAFQPSLDNSFLNFAMPADGTCASVKAKTSASWLFSLVNLWGLGPPLCNITEEDVRSLLLVLRAKQVLAQQKQSQE